MSRSWMSRFFWFSVLALSVLGAPSIQNAYAGPGDSTTLNDPWDWGGGIGFLADTPDDTAFAVNLHADYSFEQDWTAGPLAQFAFTDDLALYGFSGQLKYWFPALDDTGRLRAYAEAGVGVVHAAFRNDDTSWLVPLGAGLLYNAGDHFDLYGAFLLNITDLETGRGSDADVMPGLNFGVRF